MTELTNAQVALQAAAAVSCSKTAGNSATSAEDTPTTLRRAEQYSTWLESKRPRVPTTKWG